ncbi:hypothetical protein VOLCADRAFT_89661 [Volvox carteri f. nagariensis]|uniref:Uncharacterized protein n=1 Tax=Volvox carteri f. nagariensis TaxID=3068 RepID=D8TRR4_VOLCA|nr:uncharacterized protein VOLCADRAFT_89661 [Volvox carteri f. nagariensis]EFJ49691.1 hypothetical protein VOLCADRAFT_89661 [Volvox carteri f. nagariensis]|eukprot:XP_002949198.1 hypothetical protein VOLCADRAFT_89661 [Volvox carteri f. nagariensis]
MLPSITAAPPPPPKPARPVRRRRLLSAEANAATSAAPSATSTPPPLPPPPPPLAPAWRSALKRDRTLPPISAMAGSPRFKVDGTDREGLDLPLPPSPKAMYGIRTSPVRPLPPPPPRDAAGGVVVPSTRAAPGPPLRPVAAGGVVGASVWCTRGLRGALGSALPGGALGGV